MHFRHLISSVLFCTSILGLQSTSGSETDSAVADHLEDFGSSIYYTSSIISDAGLTPSDIAQINADLPKIESDIQAYAESVADTPQFTSVANDLAAVIPLSVQRAIESNPAEYIASLATESKEPDYFKSIPSPDRRFLTSVANHILTEVEKDLESPAVTSTTRPASRPPFPAPTETTVHPYPYPTSTSFHPYPYPYPYPYSTETETPPHPTGRPRYARFPAGSYNQGGTYCSGAYSGAYSSEAYSNGAHNGIHNKATQTPSAIPTAYTAAAAAASSYLRTTAAVLAGVVGAFVLV